VSTLRRTLAVLILAMAQMAGAAPVFAAAQGDTHGLQFSLRDGQVFDDNLYRVPEGAEHDSINRLSAGVEGAWQISRHGLSVAARLDRNDFRRNDQLDHTAGNGEARWSWVTGRVLSGEIGVDYSSALASFANTSFRSRDVLENGAALASASWNLGSRWVLSAAARQARAEHSAEERRFDNSCARSGSVGLRFRSSAQNTVGVEYRYSEGTFDHPALVEGQLFDRNYHESRASVRLLYELGPKTELKASGGYLRRDYPGAQRSGIDRGAFSGAVWDASIQWDPTSKLGLALAGYRKLSAYLDAESDYFIATGFSIAPLWNVTDKLRVSLTASREQQQYLGPSVNLTLLDTRKDRVNSGELGITYAATRVLHFDLVGRLEKRESGRALVRYDDRIASATVRLVFGM
jgi:hypothetical protein